MRTTSLARRRPSLVTTPNLDLMFRKGSKARTVAERLLTGQWLTNTELVEGLDLSRTTIPRVVKMLTDAGVPVERETNRAREAVYRVAVERLRDADTTDVAADYYGPGLEAVIVSVDALAGDEVWVTWRAADLIFRGRIIDGSEHAGALMGIKSSVVGLSILSSGLTAMRLGNRAVNILVDRVTCR